MVRNKLHKESLEIVVYEYHGEYSLPRHTYDDRKNGFARCDMICDFFGLSQMFEHEGDHPAMQGLIKALPESLGVETDMGYLYELGGSYEQIRKNLDEFADMLFEREPSGDDDSFDYWPGAFDCLWMLVHDLDEVAGNTVCADHIRARFDALGWRPNDEWIAPWENEVHEIE